MQLFDDFCGFVGKCVEQNVTSSNQDFRHEIEAELLDVAFNVPTPTHFSFQSFAFNF